MVVYTATAAPKKPFNFMRMDNDGQILAYIYIDKCELFKVASACLFFLETHIVIEALVG